MLKNKAKILVPFIRLALFVANIISQLVYVVMLTYLYSYNWQFIGFRDFFYTATSVWLKHKHFLERFFVEKFSVLALF